MAQLVPESISFPDTEEEIMKLWKEIDAFQTSLKQSLEEKRPRYTFYDGPPFATGLPHYGHILAGTIKDVVTRWAHQNGYHVDRVFGWDCHGLPVEYEIDKTLGIKGPEDVQKMGIKAYNDECRKIVMRYSKDWKEIISRLGRWIDFDTDYKTMYPWYMETIWWIFKQLFNKGLVYRGAKVMPFSTACNTPLSNFESGQNYKEVVDPAIIINFPLVEDPNVKVIAWTTTPWTLPSNLSLCVNPDMEYVKLKDNGNGETYIMMEARLDILYKSKDEYTILERFKGETIVGKSFEPIFPYFKYMKEKTNAFRILSDNYVTSDSGTGVVQQSPYFGEDDYRVCLRFGIITEDMDMICPIDECGRFMHPVSDFQGMYVKDADKKIVRMLQENGRLVHNGTVKHSYPFCWRSETPLIYKAVPSWFVRVVHARDELLKNNNLTYWVPEFVKAKRFANWLKEAKDWSVSRNRYWGTPIPLWVSDDGEEIVCVGSIEELQELTGQQVTDLHRENIDHLTIPSKMGKGVLKRTLEVFDCWFESGSMPYAQYHYPFENKKQFDDTFPADFIAEGIDQTRGWFYTLLVLSTHLFGKPPYKNLVVNGLILAEDGQKMSKRKKNYPDPMEIVREYGADALRLYLCNSPAVRAESLRFRKSGVERVLKDIFIPWYNAYRFFIQNVKKYEEEQGVKFLYNDSKTDAPSNYMDRWILSFTQSLLKFVKEEMAAYRLYTVMPRLVKFVSQLTNWYVRMNRKRLKGEGGPEDCFMALETLFSVLFAMIRVMAPLIPFITEHMYQNLRHLLDPTALKEKDIRSVHFLMIPPAREALIDKHIEKAVATMQSVIELGRVVRDRNTLPLKYPLKEVVAIHKDPEARQCVGELEYYIKEELNVKKLTITDDKDKYGAHIVAEPQFRVLGEKLKGELKTVINEVRNLTSGQLEEFQNTGEITVAGYTLGEEDLKLIYKFDSSSKDTPNHYDAHGDKDVLVLLDISPSQDMLDEGVAREVINRMQKLRKKGGLVPSDEITIYYKTASTSLLNIINNYASFIDGTIKQPVVPYPVPSDASLIVQDTFQVKKEDLFLAIVSRGESKAASKGAAVSSSVAPAPVKNGVAPVCDYVNVELCGIKSEEAVEGSVGTVLLENPKGRQLQTLDQLVLEVKRLFGVRGRSVEFYTDMNLSTKLDKQTKLTALAKKTLYLGANDTKGTSAVTSPICHFVNVEFRSKKGTLLLENPRGVSLSLEQLKNQASAVFELNGKTVELSTSSDGKNVLATSDKDLLGYHASTLYLVTK